VAKTSQEATDFVRRFFDWTKIDSNRRPECVLEKFIRWECCDFHRKLDAQSKAFSAEASQFTVVSEGMPRSQRWFEDLASKYEIELPAEKPASWI
jgi:hypothetical protein